VFFNEPNADNEAPEQGGIEEWVPELLSFPRISERISSFCCHWSDEC